MATNNFSAQSVVLDLLQYIGVTGFTAVPADQALNQPTFDTADVRRALGAVNSALQSVQKHGPRDLRETQRSLTYQAPATIALTLTQASRTATAGSAPPATMKGCSIMIEGDSDLNRIMTISGTTVTLLRAYLGASGGVNAVVYGDCASCDADVQQINEPVYGSNRIRLYPADNRDRFERLRSRCWQSGWAGWPNGYISSIEAITTQLGTPVLYLPEAQADGTVFVRMTPIPLTLFTATYQARLRAERLTSSVLDTTGAADPGYYFQTLPDDHVESILLPIARWRFVSSHPAVKNTETASRLKVEYDEAMELLKTGLKLTASVKPSRGRFI